MPDRFTEETPEEAAMLAMRRREPEAFFTYEEPCIDCGYPRSRCVCNIPDEPVCEDLYPLIMAAKTLGEVHRVCQAHRLVCAACGDVRKLPERSRETAMMDRKKAA
jgi:ribosomal protein L37E